MCWRENLSTNFKISAIQIGEIFAQQNGPRERNKAPFEAIELVLQQPAHARFLAKKFYREYVSLNAPSEETEKIAARYFKSNFEITDLLRDLSTPDFWAEENRLGLIKDPVDIILGSLRTLGYDNTSEYDTRDFSAPLRG